MQGKTPAHGQVSLHAAITRGGADNADLSRNVDEHYRTDRVRYVGGIEFDSDYFKDNENHMRHTTRVTYCEDKPPKTRISEWNIVENFLYAGEGRSDMVGDWRSEIAYAHPSADAAMKAYMDSYYETFRRHYNNALSSAIRKI